MNLWTLVAELSLNAEEYKKELGTAESFTAKFGNGVGKALSTAAKTVAVGTTAMAAAVAKVTSDAVSAYADYEQLTGGIKKLYGDAYDTMMANAKEAYSTVGLSANDYMETVTSFSASLISSLGGDTKKATEYAQTAMQSIADNANTFGKYTVEELTQVYTALSKGQYQTLDNLALGYAGTKEGMQQLLADAEGYKAEMGEVANYSVDSFADIVEAIEVVQDHLNISGTTQDEAAKTIQGSLSMTKAAWENLVTGMADDGANFGDLISKLVSSAGIALDNLLPRVEIALNGVADLVATMIPTIADRIPSLIETNLPKLVDAASSIVISLVNGLSENIESITGTAAEIVRSLVSTIAETLPDIVSAGGQIIVGLAQGIIAAVPELLSAGTDLITQFSEGVETFSASSLFDPAMELVRQLADFIIENAPTLINSAITLVTELALGITDYLPELITVALSIIEALANGLLEALPTLIDAVPDIVFALIDTLMGAIPQIIETGVTLLTSLLTNMPQILASLAEAMPKIVATMVTGLLNLVSKLAAAGTQLGSSVVNAIKSLFAGGDILSIGRNLVSGIWNGIMNAKDWIISKVKGFGKDIVKGLKSVLKIFSPSRVMRDEIGKNIALGVGVGIDQYATDAIKSAIDMSDGILDAVDDMNVGLAAYDGNYTVTAEPVEATTGRYSLKNVVDMLQEYLPQMSNTKIVMETGALVGQIAPSMDTALGRRLALAGRSV